MNYLTSNLNTFFVILISYISYAALSYTDFWKMALIIIGQIIFSEAVAVSPQEAEPAVLRETGGILSYD